jgi:hypothetical protein
MNRLVLLVFALVSPLAALMGGVLVMVRATNQDVVPYAQVFTASSGADCPQTCLFGLRPGEIDFNDALYALERHPAAVGLTRNYVNPTRVELWGANFDVMIGGRDDLLYWVKLTDTNQRDPNARPATLSNILLRFGPPQAVYVSERGAIVQLFYPGERLAVGVRRYRVTGDGPLDFDSPVFSLTLTDARAPFGEVMPYMLPRLKPWRGFVAVARYQHVESVYFSPD